MPPKANHSSLKPTVFGAQKPWSIESSVELAKAIRTGRLAMGLTQPQLALAAGCGLRFIVDLEAGKPTVRLENVLRVIEALGARLQLHNPNAPAPSAPSVQIDQRGLA